MAKASLVLGIVGGGLFLLGLIPFVGIFLLWPALICCLIGFILGIVGIIQKKNKGNAIAGTIISGVFLIINILMIVAVVGALNSMF